MQVLFQFKIIVLEAIVVKGKEKMKKCNKFGMLEGELEMKYEFGIL